MAVLLLLRTRLDRITVFHVQAANPFPETLETVAWAKTLAPDFVTIQSARPHNTIPADVVPVRASPFGRMVERTTGPQIIDRYSCCFNTIMLPMETAMKEGAFECVIRGQKLADRSVSALRDGDVVDGIRYLFPLETWSDDEVFAYLKKKGAPIPGYYSHTKGGLNCRGCSAWLHQGKLDYIKTAHPEAYQEAIDGLNFVAAELQRPLTRMQEVLHGSQ